MLRKRIKRLHNGARATLFIVVATFMATASGSIAHGVEVTSGPLPADSIYSPYGNWNGYKVYLSPSRHSPDNSGCGTFKENVGARDTAQAATYSPYRNGVYYPTWQDRGSLSARGYRTRIGDGTINTAISNSNAWGADLHIPIHSNAQAFNCSTTYNSYGGTWVMYRSSAGSALSDDIRDTVGPSSPGTGDRICTDQACAGYNLGELRYTDAVAAYLEQDFHTWDRGVSWIRSSYPQWGWRIGNGIDVYLGYPR